MLESGQKFIAKNRAPRVQIEYDVELYGAEKKINLPFVMGVMAELATTNTASEIEQHIQSVSYQESSAHFQKQCYN